jgi:hypothetical protein
MRDLYEVTVKYDQMTDKGQRRISEMFLFDAVNFTDAETRAYKELKTLGGNLAVRKIAINNYAEIFENDFDGEKWFKVKVTMITFIPETMKEKKTNMNMLILADSVEQADKDIRKKLEVTMQFEITAVMETRIMQYFPYREEPEKLPEAEQQSLNL